MNVIFYIVYVIMPIAVLLRVWLANRSNFWMWIIENALFTVVAADLFLTAPWPLTFGFYGRYVFIGLYLMLLGRSFLRLRKHRRDEQPKKKKILLSGLCLSLTALFAFRVSLAIPSQVMPNATALEFPLKGEHFYILQGGPTVVLNHHNPIKAQQFALDILQNDSWGFRSKSWIPTKNTDFNIYGASIHSPCDGVIVKAIDGQDDQSPRHMDESKPAGNFLAIKCANQDVVILLAHLKKGSLRVKDGDRVVAGQKLARVGNSGHTSEPHLHIHAVKSGYKNLLYDGESVPISFQGRQLARNDTLSSACIGSRESVSSSPIA